MGNKVMKTMDGNTAAAHVAYAFTDVAAIYPITPSSNMAESVDEWSAKGLKNIFGRPVEVSEMQSEGGAAGAVHGSLQAGALTTTFTASQGLLLMVPNMYKMAGELLPAVFHVSARAIAGHALSIFGDHSDVMATRQTGFAMISTCSVQEVMDLGGVAHLAAIKSRIPFLHFFDGFRTSHEVQKVEVIDYEDFNKLVDHDAINEFRQNSLSPERPVTRGTAQNPDIFFQAKEVSNKFYDRLPEIVEDYFGMINKLTGRDYKLFNYYGDPNAERVVIAMGSVCEAIEETVDYLMERGEKVGLIKVRLYRPWSNKHFFEILPKTVKKIAVLDRTKEPGSDGEPLYKDIRSTFYNSEITPLIIGGRYGLGSKDTTPSHLKCVFDELKKDQPKNNFTIGILDDLTGLSLNVEEPIVAENKSTIRCKFWGLGSDGTVGANKSAIKIIGDNTKLYSQGYFAYDSKKSGGVTVSHLRFGSEPIRSTYLIDEADYVACHNQSYVYQYDLLKGLKKGGRFVLNCKWSAEELDEHLPGQIRKYIAKNDIEFYTMDATSIAEEIGLGSRINMLMQAAFFKLAEVIDIDEAVKYLKDAVKTAYGRKGDKIVRLNNEAIELGIQKLVKVDVPEYWAEAEDQDFSHKDDPEYIAKILRPMAAQAGDSLPVSAFVGYEDGTFEHGTSAYEKRGIAVNIPKWRSEHCIQCNQCSYVCPHAAIRPFLLNEDEAAASPDEFFTIQAKGKGFEGIQYKIQVSPFDCTGCSNCADVCPAKEKALVMEPLDSLIEKESKNWNYAINLPQKDNVVSIGTVKGSQFQKPLFEFSGACAGCGETPYIKAVTQLYGDRMMIANATGCSSIWGASAPSTPYTINDKGQGPAWANSLFEDNAEYGYGMAIAVKTIRSNMVDQFAKAQKMNLSQGLKEAISSWTENMEDAEESKKASKSLLDLVSAEKTESTDAKGMIKYIMDNKDYLVKRSVWIVGGDGWAYDIGFGGLDHVLASGEDVNVLVFDTEVYSNTGGQASKATPVSAVAKFASAGMRAKKKDLGMIAATYGYIYVAQVAMGANQAHFLKVVQEAESYKGPSLIICYAPCIAHGLKSGMGKTIRREKEAVEAGYWHLWRFDPRLKDAGKNPFLLDSREPKASFREFLTGESRFSMLEKMDSALADKLYEIAEENAKDRYEGYVRMSKMEY